LPRVVKGADVCWFALPLTYAGDRGQLVTYLEEHGIETRSMFAGNILRHPAYKDIEARTSGTLNGANYILEHSFWISVHPRLSKADLKYMCNVFDEFFKFFA